MIKLIVSDLDGTLLDDNKNLPKEFDKLLFELSEKGVIFSTASGRNYLTQAFIFPKHLDKMSFICDNGAYIREQNCISQVSIICPHNWKAIVAAVQERQADAVCVLCGLNGAYSVDFSSNPEISQVMGTIYTGLKYVDNLLKIEDDIFKISICCPNAAITKLKPLLTEVCPPDVSALVTHPSFMDVMNIGISKGSAIEFLQEKHGISHDETMIFGDYYNDIDMLSKGKYSYIMANAPDDMKEFAAFIAPNNNVGGVASIISNYIKTI